MMQPRTNPDRYGNAAAMNRIGIYPILALVVLATLACVSGIVRPTATVQPTITRPPTAIVTPSPTSAPMGFHVIYPTATPEIMCTVRTGYKGGTVNIRSGPGMDYPVVGVAEEGELLYVMEPPVFGWSPVRAFDGTGGFFYVSEWCKE